jgi:hypothetical protein
MKISDVLTEAVPVSAPADVAAVYESQMARAIAWATGRTK